MPWTLTHMPLREEWEETFKTKKEAVAKLRKHICKYCMSGREKFVDPTAPGGFFIRKTKKPSPTSARDLLSTPCGCEYKIDRVLTPIKWLDKPTEPHERLGNQR